MNAMYYCLSGCKFKRWAASHESWSLDATQSLPQVLGRESFSYSVSTVRRYHVPSTEKTRHTHTLSLDPAIPETLNSCDRNGWTSSSSSVTWVKSSRHLQNGHQ